MSYFVYFAKTNDEATCLSRSANLFVELVAGPQSVLDGVLVVGGVEVEQVHAVGPQPLKGGFQLGAHALWRQRLPVPGVGLGGYADWE